jgi:hypothetical protein
LSRRTLFTAVSQLQTHFLADQEGQQNLRGLQVEFQPNGRLGRLVTPPEAASCNKSTGSQKNLIPERDKPGGGGLVRDV